MGETQDRASVRSSQAGRVPWGRHPAGSSVSSPDVVSREPDPRGGDWTKPFVMLLKECATIPGLGIKEG